MTAARRALEKICDDMHLEVVSLLVIAIGRRLPPAVIQRLRDIYDDALRRAMIVGEVRGPDREDSEVGIDGTRSIRDTSPGFRSRRPPTK